MEAKTAAERLAALGHETRLAVFRMLVEAGPSGVSAGQIAERLDIPLPTLSFHLAHLSRVGLIEGRQESRYIFYAADYAAMNALLSYLMANCCRGLAAMSGTAPAAKRRKPRRSAATARESRIK